MPEDTSPTLFTKEWIRENWDYERDNARKSVVLVKLLHEFHIALPGTLAAVLLWYILPHMGLPKVFVISTVLTAFGAGYGLYFNRWWCSVLAR